MSEEIKKSINIPLGIQFLTKEEHLEAHVIKAKENYKKYEQVPTKQKAIYIVTSEEE
mgnify:CR=1 FL=1